MWPAPVLALPVPRTTQPKRKVEPALAINQKKNRCDEPYQVTTEYDIIGLFIDILV